MQQSVDTYGIPKRDQDDDIMFEMLSLTKLNHDYDFISPHRLDKA